MHHLISVPARSQIPYLRRSLVSCTSQQVRPSFGWVDTVDVGSVSFELFKWQICFYVPDLHCFIGRGCIELHSVKGPKLDSKLPTNVQNSVLMRTQYAQIRATIVDIPYENLFVKARSNQMLTLRGESDAVNLALMPNQLQMWGLERVFLLRFDFHLEPRI